MKKHIFFLILVFVINTVSSQQDCDNCEDYSILPRMPDYYIEKYEESEFDSQEFYFNSKKQLIEGKKIIINYKHTNSKDKEYKFPTRLQVLRNYSNAISSAGGTILFERSNSEHGYYNFATTDHQKKIWVKVKPASKGNSYSLIIIEQDEMRQDIVITADLIAEKINIYGKIELKGIFFDIGKATIKKESESAITELAQYLKTYPKINCWVVGHTSSEGSFELNSKLSLKRAEAIKSNLEQHHNIAPGRLFAEGVGPLAPIASNHTEEGKKKNRRVELVLK